MKYVFLRDLNVLKNNKTIIIVYSLCLILFCLFTKYISGKIELDNIELKALGMLFEKNFLTILIYILNISVSVYLSVLFFTSDVKYGGQNIFSRVIPSKYFLMKFFSTTLILLLLKIWCHMVVDLCYLTFLDFDLFLKNYFYNLIIYLLVINIYILKVMDKKLLCPCIIAVFILLSMNLNFLSSAKIPLGTLMLVSLFLLILYMSFSKFLFDIYERID